MSIIPDSNVFVIKVEPISPSRYTDEGNEYEQLLVHETKYQPPPTVFPVGTPVCLARRAKKSLEPVGTGAAPIHNETNSYLGPGSEISEREIIPTSEIKKFVEGLLEKMGQERLLTEIKKRGHARRLEAFKSETPATTNDFPNVASNPSTQIQPRTRQPEPASGPRSVQAVAAAGNPKTKAEPQRKKTKLSSEAQQVRDGPVMSVTPFNVNASSMPRKTFGVLRFFECPTCCQQFTSKPATQQHFRTCKKPFNSKANNLKFL